MFLYDTMCYSGISVMSDSLRSHLGFFWQRYWSGLPFPSPTHSADKETEANRLSDLPRVTQLVSEARFELRKRNLADSLHHLAACASIGKIIKVVQ